MVAFLSLLLSLLVWLPAGDLQSGDDQGVGASGGSDTLGRTAQAGSQGRQLEEVQYQRAVGAGPAQGREL